MRIVDLIEKKRNGEAFDEQTWKDIVTQYTNGQMPDYQMAALLMAICFQGLTKQETAYLTLAMEHSGQTIDLSSIEGVKVDKHSTGGVGDKTSLVLGPMVSACGAVVAKMSGRGLGHTGGTLDKMESIEGLSIDISKDDFMKQVDTIGIAIIGQSASLVPADKKMYALRDVTGTVSCIPLIASSIMSKKIASGSDAILLDVKYGEGAFMKTVEDAKVLARTMIDIGTLVGRDTRASISNMSQPLGNAIGNSLEVIEAIETLKGNGPEDLVDLCLTSGSHMLVQAKLFENEESARVALQESIDNGSALEKLRQMVSWQHGNVAYIDDVSLFKKATNIVPVYSKEVGYVERVQADTLGIISMKLGGGRLTKEDEIDHSVGIILNKKIGDFCQEGDILAWIHANRVIEDELLEDFYNAYTITRSKIEKPLLIDEILV